MLLQGMSSRSLSLNMGTMHSNTVEEGCGDFCESKSKTDSPAKCRLCSYSRTFCHRVVLLVQHATILCAEQSVPCFDICLWCRGAGTIYVVAFPFNLVLCLWLLPAALRERRIIANTINRK